MYTKYTYLSEHERFLPYLYTYRYEWWSFIGKITRENFMVNVWNVCFIQLCKQQDIKNQ